MIVMFHCFVMIAVWQQVLLNYELFDRLNLIRMLRYSNSSFLDVDRLIFYLCFSNLLSILCHLLNLFLWLFSMVRGVLAVVLLMHIHGNTIYHVVLLSTEVCSSRDDRHADTIHNKPFYRVVAVDVHHKRCICVHLLLYSHIRSNTCVGFLNRFFN